MREKRREFIAIILFFTMRKQQRFRDSSIVLFPASNYMSSRFLSTDWYTCLLSIVGLALGLDLGTDNSFARH